MLFALAALITVDQPVTAAGQSRPVQPLAALLTDSDYPAGALRRGVSGTVNFTLDVGADGTPTRCTITHAVDAELDRTTCDIAMARMRFQPVRGGSGHAAAGAFAGRVRWVLPEAETGLMPFTAIHLASVMSLDPQSNLTCLFSINGSPPSRPGDGQCRLPGRFDAAQAIRARAVPNDLVVIFSLVPEGMAAAAGGHEEDGAELVFEETAHLVITPDGRVAECRPGADRINRFPPSIHIPGICQGSSPPFMTPTSDQQPRQAEIAARVYFRRRPAP